MREVEFRAELEGRVRLDPAAVETGILALSGADLRSAEIERLVELLGPVFTGYFVQGRRFRPGLQVFRARVTEKPKHVRELLYPPRESVKRPGRVNSIGESVFYAAGGRECCIFEVDPKPGDTVVVARWRTNRPMLCNVVGYSQDAFGELGSNRECAKMELPLDPESVRINETVTTFLAREFTRRVKRGEEHLYKITIAIAQSMFADKLFDGLLYPSIAMFANGDNLAIKTEFADTALTLERVEFMTVRAVRDKQFEVDVHDTAIEQTPDGCIAWRGRLDQWVLAKKGDTLMFTAENGRWVARDLAGRVVEPT